MRSSSSLHDYCPRLFCVEQVGAVAVKAVTGFCAVAGQTQALNMLLSAGYVVQ